MSNSQEEEHKTSAPGFGQAYSQKDLPSSSRGSDQIGDTQVRASSNRSGNVEANKGSHMCGRFPLLFRSAETEGTTRRHRGTFRGPSSRGFASNALGVYQLESMAAISH